MSKNLETRFWEIDILRGVAVIAMIAFHFVYDLNFFGVQDFNPHVGIWLILARITASMFLLLVGISLTMSYTRAVQKDKKNIFPKYVRRGLSIFGWGIVITVITWIFLSAGLILFGVLHLIGVSIILAYPFIRYRYRNLVIGAVIIIVGLYLSFFRVDFSWLLWLGAVPNGLYMLDYFPILPWFGLVLVGIFLGNSLYRDYKRRFPIKDVSNHPISRAFIFLGRNSLIIYLLHQPILIAVLYLLGFVDIGLVFT